MSRIPLIVDTDVFGDPDDLLALCYLLANKQRAEIKLIVTSDEHQGMRAAWLLSLLLEAGEEIPVVAGEDLGNTRLFLFEDINTKRIDSDYIKAIKSVVEQNDYIEYLCMAPQSNLAKFITKYPNLKDKIKVRAMGASLDIDLGRIEHNVRGDIEAFRIVATQMQPKLLLADHTWHKSMKFSRNTEIYSILKKSAHPLARAAIKNADLFFDKLYPESRFHDPILVSSLFGDFIKFKNESIEMDSDGKTYRSQSNNGEMKVEVSLSVKYEAMYSDFISSLKSIAAS